MMHSETTKIALDACVFAEAAVSDLLLRLAEDPGLIDVRWSLPIWEQTRSAWIGKLGWSPSVADRRIHAACTTFPEAMVEGFEPWIDARIPPPKDRHVLAVAIATRPSQIATFNTNDFQNHRANHGT